MGNLSERLQKTYDKLKDINNIEIIPDISTPSNYLQVFLGKRLVATFGEGSKPTYVDCSPIFKLIHFPTYSKLKSVDLD